MRKGNYKVLQRLCKCRLKAEAFIYRTKEPNKSVVTYFHINKDLAYVSALYRRVKVHEGIQVLSIPFAL